MLMDAEAKRMELETQKLMELHLADQARAEAEHALVRLPVVCVRVWVGLVQVILVLRLPTVIRSFLAHFLSQLAGRTGACTDGGGDGA
jgi:hypothetical protein